jgi:hypothetical protein
MAKKDVAAEQEGQEPLEEVSAIECDAPAQTCENRNGELDGKPHESQIVPMDEIAEQIQIENVTIGISPIDGLPIPLDESPQLSLAPAFSHDNVLCIEDARQFAEVFEEELRPDERKALASMNAPNTKVYERERQLTASAFAAGTLVFVFAIVVDSTAMCFVAGALIGFAIYRSLRPARNSKRTGAVPSGDMSFGARSKFMARGKERDRLTFSPAAIQVRFGTKFVRLRQSDPLRDGLESIDAVLVRPIREGCVHYKRQMFANDDVSDPSAPGHRLMFRNCMMRRSVGGAFMSLRDEAVYACDYRNPPTLASSKLLDETDESILQKSANRTLVPLFNLTAKLPKKE